MMDTNGQHDRKLLEALDACRAGSDDLALPELAEAAARVAREPQARRLHERIERLDVRIGEAMCDVEPPAGLAERLLLRLAAAAASAAGPAVAAESSPSSSAAAPDASTAASSLSSPVASSSAGATLAGIADQRACAASSRRGWLRRLAVGTAALAASAAAVFLTIQFWPQAPAAWTQDKALETAIERFLAGLPDDGAQPLSSAPSHLPPSADLIVAPQTRWQPVEMFHVPGVAYELSTRGLGEMRAVLFATTALVEHLPSGPPPGPMRDTRGVCAGAWRSGEVTYLLVVEGTAANYRALLRSRGATLAHAGPAWQAGQPTRLVNVVPERERYPHGRLAS